MGYPVDAQEKKLTTRLFNAALFKQQKIGNNIKVHRKSMSYISGGVLWSIILLLKNKKEYAGDQHDSEYE